MICYINTICYYYVFFLYYATLITLFTIVTHVTLVTFATLKSLSFEGKTVFVSSPGWHRFSCHDSLSNENWNKKEVE